jgi:hypothetical protein
MTTCPSGTRRGVIFGAVGLWLRGRHNPLLFAAAPCAAKIFKLAAPLQGGDIGDPKALER